MRGSIRAGLSGLVVLFSSATVSGAANTQCNLSFEVIAGKNLGTVRTGDKLQGTIGFGVKRVWRHDDETMSYFANGKMRLTSEGKGTVEADVRVVHVVRSPNVGDYLSIDAWKTRGNLGGETRYEDPMLATFYGRIGTLGSHDIPLTMNDWAQLSPRRVWQVHTPDAMAVFSGDIVNLGGSCN